MANWGTVHERNVDERGKLGFNRKDGILYFSLPVERKVPKERHVREARPPLRNPPSGARLLHPQGAKESECAEGRGHPTPRTNGGAPSARNKPEARR